MKKIIIVFICLLLLVGCQTEDINYQLYREMIDILSSSKEYISSSKYYSITFETTNTNEGKRYFIVIDNPTITMYDVDVIAFEENADLENEFAPNAGIFDEKINLVPNQINKEKGYVKGISISGICSSDNPVVYCLVQWKDEKNIKLFRECFKITNS